MKLNQGPVNYYLNIIKLIIFLDFFAVSLVVPLLSSYFRDAGIDSKMYGLISSLYAISQIFGGLTMGILADVLRKKDILFLSFVGSVISYGIVGLSSDIRLLFASRVIVGLVKQTFTICTTIVTELTEGNVELRAVELGRISAVLSLSFVFGPFIGGLMYKIDKRIPAIVAVFIFLSNILLTMFLLPPDHSSISTSSHTPSESTTDKKSSTSLRAFLLHFRELISNRNIALVLALKCVGEFIDHSMSQSNIVNYYEARFGIETYQRGYLSSTSAISNLITQSFLIGPKLAFFQRSDFNLYIFGLLVVAASAVFEYFVSSIPLYIALCLMPNVIATGLITAANRSIFSRSVSKDDTGKVLGVQGVLVSAVGVVSPLYGSHVLLSLGSVRGKGLVVAAHYAAMAVLVAVIAACAGRPVRSPSSDGDADADADAVTVDKPHSD